MVRRTHRGTRNPESAQARKERGTERRVSSELDHYFPQTAPQAGRSVRLAPPPPGLGVRSKAEKVQAAPASSSGTSTQVKEGEPTGVKAREAESVRVAPPPVESATKRVKKEEQTCVKVKQEHIEWP